MPLDAQSEQRYGLHRQPRLSAAQVADYLTAGGAGRRTSIIREARFPKAAIVAQYRDARSIITKLLCAPSTTPTAVEDMVDLMRRRAVGRSDWTVQDCERSAEAIATFVKADNPLALRQFEFRAVSGPVPPLTVGGVDISVSLDATVHRKERVGGLLLTFAKRIVATGSAGERLAISSLLSLMFAEKHLTYAGQPDSKLCFTLHVGSGNLMPAPKSQVARRSKIAEACDEISDRWRRVSPPKDYDGPDPG